VSIFYGFVLDFGDFDLLHGFIFHISVLFCLSVCFVVFGGKVVLFLVATRWHFISAVLWHLWGKSRLSYLISQIKESQLDSPFIIPIAWTDYNFSFK